MLEVYHYQSTVTHGSSISLSSHHFNHSQQQEGEGCQLVGRENLVRYSSEDILLTQPPLLFVLKVLISSICYHQILHCPLVKFFLKSKYLHNILENISFIFPVLVGEEWRKSVLLWSGHPKWFWCSPGTAWSEENRLDIFCLYYVSPILGLDAGKIINVLIISWYVFPPPPPPFFENHILGPWKAKGDISVKQQDQISIFRIITLAEMRKCLCNTEIMLGIQ